MSKFLRFKMIWSSSFEKIIYGVKKRRHSWMFSSVLSTFFTFFSFRIVILQTVMGCRLKLGMQLRRIMRVFIQSTNHFTIVGERFGELL